MSDAAVVGALRRALTLAAAKQVVASSNLANVNTPGFKAKELSFESTLSDRVGLRLETTNAGHLGGANLTQPLSETREADGQARRDGNTVQLDRELLAMSRAGGDFARAQTALSAKFRLVRYALQELR
jgi:flagellar basal-body rod protein FlgB